MSVKNKIFQKIIDFFNWAGKDILIIFLSVSMAFIADRYYDDYQEEKELKNALRNFCNELKHDLSKDSMMIFRLEKNITQLKVGLNNDNLSLFEMDSLDTFQRFSFYNISLEYIQKNHKLKLDNRVMNLVSEFSSLSLDLHVLSEKAKDLPYSNDYYAKGATARVQKLKAIHLYSLIVKKMYSIHNSFLAFEKIFLVKHII